MTETGAAAGRKAPALDDLRWPAPAAEGYRWPAEWERHEATWLSWPHNPDTWPGAGRLERVESVFAQMALALCDGERVRINVADAAMGERVSARLRGVGVDVEGRVDLVRAPTDDAWVRDHGPIFVVRRTRGGSARLMLDFAFDAWGGKYPPWNRDDAVPTRIEEARGELRRAVPIVLEGGSLDGDGAGTILTTESCLLNPNRGPGRTRELWERVLADTLGARRVLWLGDGIAGDDTDGHVDDITRFVAEGVVVTVSEPDASDVNHAPLAENLARLRTMRDARGASLRVIELPMPRPLTVDGQRCPASYANFYVANAVVLVPVFDDPADERALSILRECFANRRVVPVPGRDLVVGLGGPHCLTKEEPAIR